MKMIQTEFGSFEGFEQILVSMLFFGMLIGSLIVGQIADRIGRRPPFLIFNLQLCIFNGWSASASTYWEFLFTTFYVGLAIGALVPLSKVILAEITPVKYRGRLVTLMGAAFAFGELVAAVVAWFMLDNLNEGNWRGAVAWLCIPAAVSCVYLYFVMDECSRFDYLNGKEEEAWETLGIMAKDNVEDEEKIKDILTEKAK